MIVRSSLVLLVTLVMAVVSQDFTASFQMTTSSMGTGVVVGTYSYSSTLQSIKVTFTSQSYEETFIYAKQPSGFGQGYLTGTCGCEVASISAPMPSYSVSDAVNWNIGATDSNGCTRYDRKTGSYPAYSIWMKSTGVVCQAYFAETTRTFVFSSFSKTTLSKSNFPTPTGCICLTPLDIAIVLDRSGSISPQEWVYQKSFAINFAMSFDYATTSANSALKTNLALVNFNTAATTAWTLAQGSTLNNVNASLQALGCCSNGDSTSCCIGWTSISSGIRSGADVLSASTRTLSNKVMLIVTDGFHNTPYQLPNSQCYKTCSNTYTDATQSMLDCITSPTYATGRKTCLNDLQAAADYAYSKVPGLTIYTVAVGPVFSSPLAEFDIITKTQRTNQFSATDFTLISTILNSVTTTVCGKTTSPCSSCCGFCACGVCRVPDSCLAGPCLDASISGTCCKQTPHVCTSNDLCKVPSCVNNSVCTTTPYPCPAPNQCYSYSCVAGSCQQTFLGVPTDSCKTAVCVQPSSDPSTWYIQQKDICTPGSDLCVNYGCTAGTCTAVPKPLPNLCYNCTNGVFIPKTCSPRNKCETASCNVASGSCQYTPIVCSDPLDLCNTSTCSLTTGQCVPSRVLCTDDPINKCSLTSGCNKASGKCEYYKKSCNASTDCRDNLCQNSTGNCSLISGPGCVGLCSNISCGNVSTVCIQKSCNSSALKANCDIVTTLDAQCNASVGSDNCKVYSHCDNAVAGGCVFTQISCPADPPCKQYVKDSTYAGCCKAIDKPCGSDPCLIYTCNNVTGACSSVQKCGVSDACTIRSCSATGNCTSTNITCTLPSPCHIYTGCNTLLGCQFKLKNCADSDPCTIDSCNSTTGKCANTPKNCDDGNFCTDDKCRASDGVCVTVAHVCNDSNACTVDTCNSTLKKCVFTNRTASYCDDNNACTKDSCNAQKGCVHTPIVCNDSNRCTNDTCDRTYGCLYSPYVCTTVLPCTLALCKNTTGNCTTVPLYCSDDTTLILASSVTGGVLAGIIIGAVIAAGLCSGGSYLAYSQMATSGEAPVIANNPLYAQPAPANNPLYTPA